MYKTTYQIDGMMCGMCESHVNDVFRQNFQVKKVSSSHKKGITEVISDEPLEEEKVRAAVEQMGYRVLSGHTEEYEKKFSLFGRKKE